MDSLQKAREARAMLDSPLFVEARANIAGQLEQLRRDVPIAATEMHTRLILMGQLADRFFGFFEQLAQTGKMEELRLADERRRQNLIEQGLMMFRQRGRGAM